MTERYTLTSNNQIKDNEKDRVLIGDEITKEILKKLDKIENKINKDIS